MPRSAPDAAFEEEPGQEEVFLAVLAYVPVLCLLPTLSRSESRFARAHGRQGVVLFLAEVLAGMLAFVPSVGCYLAWGLAAVLIGAGAASAWRALHRQYWRIPLIGDVAERLHSLAP